MINCTAGQQQHVEIFRGGLTASGQSQVQVFNSLFILVARPTTACAASTGTMPARAPTLNAEPPLEGKVPSFAIQLDGDCAGEPLTAAIEQVAAVAGRAARGDRRT